MKDDNKVCRYNDQGSWKHVTSNDKRVMKYTQLIQSSSESAIPLLFAWLFDLPFAEIVWLHLITRHGQASTFSHYPSCGILVSWSFAGCLLDSYCETWICCECARKTCSDGMIALISSIWNLRQCFKRSCN